MSPIFFAFIGAVFAGLTVALGAFAAHALKAILDSYSQSVWEKAVFYQAIHSLALLILPTMSHLMTPKTLQITGYLFIAGIFLFSGSLFVLAVTGRKYLGAITPFGGIAFILGWTWLAVSLFKAVFHS
ncbi:MAG: DUF423 domain-containing protein [Candidatus Marinimicrobia bacterium]|nr:DUF423 domain-containing protein [Candidatus Neomarinimicrobiota bacterium]